MCRLGGCRSRSSGYFKERLFANAPYSVVGGTKIKAGQLVPGASLVGQAVQRWAETALEDKRLYFNVIIPCGA